MSVLAYLFYFEVLSCGCIVSRGQIRMIRCLCCRSFMYSFTHLSIHSSITIHALTLSTHVCILHVTAEDAADVLWSGGRDRHQLLWAKQQVWPGICAPLGTSAPAAATLRRNSEGFRYNCALHMCIVFLIFCMLAMCYAERLCPICTFSF